ncbi:GNAT family N-acetyltransferase [Citricoccus sp. GCM10030269]|uniref:GNAT family N-acetyltransferase n=1 Tax=Citricoccus sp. GCM10030269 TaxID=3273388 RepID=UPI0036185C65
MKIGMITQWYDPEPGPAALPGVLARELVKRGHNVNVVTGFPNYPDGRIVDGYKLKPRMRETLDGVNVTRTYLFPSHDGSLAKRLLNYGSFGASAAALGLDSLRGADAVWVNYSPITVALPMFLQRYLRGTPLISEVADLWPDTVMVSGFTAGSAAGRVTGPVLDAWVGSMYRASDAVVHIAPSVGRILAERGVPSAKTHYIPKPANEDVFHPFGRSIRDELNVGEDQVVLLYAGAMGAAQGLETLMVASRSLDPEKIVCIMAGGGNDEERLRDLAADAPAVRFIGRVPQERMSNLMASADIAYISLVDDPLTPLTMPSKTQAILASGTATLVAASGDVVDVVQSAGAGLAVDQNDPADIARGLQQLVSLGRAGLAAMGATARRTYEDQFSVEKTTDKAEQLLGLVAGRPLAQRPQGNALQTVPLQRSHIDTVAALHRRSFPRFFLSELGEGFLREFYRGFLDDPSAVTAVVVDAGGKVKGAAVGTTEPPGFFRRLLKRRLFGFVARSASIALREPARAPRLLRAVAYRGEVPPDLPGAALLSSICVDPESQGQGVGGVLLRGWTEQASQQGAQAAMLTTDADGNDAVNAFYQRLGWELHDAYSTPEDRRMNRYVKNLERPVSGRTDDDD